MLKMLPFFYWPSYVLVFWYFGPSKKQLFKGHSAKITQPNTRRVPGYRTQVPGRVCWVPETARDPPLWYPRPPEARLFGNRDITTCVSVALVPTFCLISFAPFQNIFWVFAVLHVIRSGAMCPFWWKRANSKNSLHTARFSSVAQYSNRVLDISGHALVLRLLKRIEPFKNPENSKSSIF